MLRNDGGPTNVRPQNRAIVGTLSRRKVVGRQWPDKCQTDFGFLYAAATSHTLGESAR